MDDSRDREAEDEANQFKVTDRRQFTSEGETRQDPEPQPEPSEAPPPPAEPLREAPQEAPPDSADEDSQEGMNFASFLLSLATTGMVHLGEIPEPPTGQTLENLEAARQMIDILGILKEKTEGNLTPEESQLMENMLYEMRMRFLAKSKDIQL